MKNETVYVVVESWQFDSGDVGENVRVYESLEEAQKYLLDLYALAKEETIEKFPDNWNVSSDDMSFSFWESDNYNYNHHDGTIYQREVR